MNNKKIKFPLDGNIIIFVVVVTDFAVLSRFSLFLFLKICQTFSFCLAYYPLLTSKYQDLVIIYILMFFFFPSTIILFGYDSHIVLFDLSASLEFGVCVL